MTEKSGTPSHCTTWLLWRGGGAALMVLGLAAILSSWTLVNFVVGRNFPELLTQDEKTIRYGIGILVACAIIVGMLPVMIGAHMWRRGSRTARKQLPLRRTRFLLWRGSGAMLMVLGLAVFLLSPLVAGFLIGVVASLAGEDFLQHLIKDKQELRNSIFDLTPFVMILGMIPLIAGARMWRRGTRVNAPTAETLLAPGARPVVLYLRSFGIEWFANALGLSWEQQVVHVLQRFAPVVAVGRPGERLPPLGAARWYMQDEDWQSEVTRQLDRAALVLLRFGSGEGIVWETEQALHRVIPQRLVLLVPSRGRALARFAMIATPEIRNALQMADLIQPFWRKTILIWFGRDGQPRIAGSGPSRSGWRRRFGQGLRLRFESDLNNALRPIFEMHGIDWRPLRPSPWRWFLIALPWIIILLLYMITQLMQRGVQELDRNIAPRAEKFERERHRTFSTPDGEFPESLPAGLSEAGRPARDVSWTVRASAHAHPLACDRRIVFGAATADDAAADNLVLPAAQIATS